MALTQVTGPYPIFTDLDGTPLDDGYLYIGDVNQDPEQNPIQVFWDANLTIAATQPIRTSNGYAYRNGTPALLYTGGEFSITIRNKREEFVLYSPVGYGFDPAAVSASVVKNDFIGNGVQVDFVLSASPSTILATNIFINGVYQEKDSYTLSGNTITFSIAPPLSSSIEVMTNETGVINAGNATAISYTASFAGATAQTVQTKLEQYVSVKDFGAVGDGVANDTAAVQAAIDYAGSLNGAEVFFPAGNYSCGTLTTRENVTLRGITGLQGGAAQITFTGAIAFQTEASGSFNFFNMYNLTMFGVRFVTNFVNQDLGGSWAYSTINGCYFANFLKMDVLTTGNRFTNNNIKNFVSCRFRGADFTIADNFFGFDEDDTTATSADAFVSLVAATGIDFSGNYITSMKTVNAPIPMVVGNCQDVRLISNWFDGGKDHCLAFTSGAMSCVATANRLAALYAPCVPILLSNVTDITANDNIIQGLAASAPFITFGSTLARCVVHGNIVNNRSDATVHDYVTAAATTVSGVSMRGYGLAVKNLSANFEVYPPVYGRTLTNQSATGLVFFYVYPSTFIAGDYFNFNRLNTGQRLIIQDVEAGVSIYDSNTAGFNRGSVTSYSNGTVVVES